MSIDSIQDDEFRWLRLPAASTNAEIKHLVLQKIVGSTSWCGLISLQNELMVVEFNGWNMAMPLPPDARFWRVRIKVEMDRGTPAGETLQIMRQTFANHLREQDAWLRERNKDLAADLPVSPEIKAAISRLK